MAHRLTELLFDRMAPAGRNSGNFRHLKSEATDGVEKEIARLMEQPKDDRVIDMRLRVLFRGKERWEQASANG